MDEDQRPEEQDDIRGIEFEWYPGKAEMNLRKHGVSFEEASTIFGDRRLLTVPDVEHSYDEERYLAIGMSEQGRLITLIFTNRDDRIRIISARLSESWERREYETTNEQG
jgi:uncharacterized protein